MTTAKIIYRAEDSEVEFTWGGGAYVEVLNLASGEAFDVINVWDDVEDMSNLEVETRDHAENYRRPFRTILETFEAICQRYLDDEGF